MSNTHGYCPHCGTNWDGIEEAGVVYGRQIGIDGSRMGVYDGLVAWKCPDCSMHSPIDQSPLSLELYYEFLDVVQDGTE